MNRKTRTRVGTVSEEGDGLSIATDKGLWYLNDTQALELATALTRGLRGRLTRWWSADDHSTILSRGVR